MNKESILIAGCGDVGSALGLQLLARGHRVYGLRRNINQLPSGIQAIRADLTQPDTLTGLPEAVDILVYAVAAGRRDEQRYRDAYVNGLDNLLNQLAQQQLPPRQIFFVSSTAVYHQQHDEWVTEASATAPDNFSGKIMLEAEGLALSRGVAATVVRFSGIYGPGRNYMLNQVNKGIGYPAQPLRYSNRIHRDDCVGVLLHLIGLSQQQSLHPIYLASDHHPALLSEVSGWLASELGVEITATTARRTIGSKRCDSSLLRASGYRFRYPSYRDGYRDLISEFKNSR